VSTRTAPRGEGRVSLPSRAATTSSTRTRRNVSSHHRRWHWIPRCFLSRSYPRNDGGAVAATDIDRNAIGLLVVKRTRDSLPRCHLFHISPQCNWLLPDVPLPIELRFRSTDVPTRGPGRNGFRLLSFRGRRESLPAFQGDVSGFVQPTVRRSNQRVLMRGGSQSHRKRCESFHQCPTKVTEIPRPAASRLCPYHCRRVVNSRDPIFERERPELCCNSPYRD